jgi:hypothetical protein
MTGADRIDSVRTGRLPPSSRAAASERRGAMGLEWFLAVETELLTLLLPGIVVLGAAAMVFRSLRRYLL